MQKSRGSLFPDVVINFDDNFFSENKRELIYYSGSNGTWGTPILNSGALLHYTPIPEECAVWTDDIYSDYPWWNPPRDLGIREQIRTGLRVPYHGHTYVEMIYRSYDYRSNTYTPDSLLGYFRNDTANAKVLFYHSLTDSSFMEYDFSSLCPAPNCLSQVMVGGQPRTMWPDYIEGVGGVNGLIPVKEISFTPQIGLPPQKWGASYFSFCVCGQTLYTTDSTINCDLISGLSDERLGISHFAVFPNPAKQFFNLSFSITEADFFTARILDLQGKTVSPDYHFGRLNEGTHTEQINLPPLSSGMYFLECSTAKGKLYEQLVVE